MSNLDFVNSWIKSQHSFISETEGQQLTELFSSCEQQLRNRFPNSGTPNNGSTPSNGANSKNVPFTKIKILEKNLKSMKQLMTDNDEARKDLGDVFPKWYKMRSATVNGVRNCAQVIRNDNEITEVQSVCCSVGSLGGGVLMATSLICPPAAPVLMPLGATISTGFGIVKAAATSGNVRIANSQARKARELIKKEQNVFNPMLKYLSHTNEVIEGIENIIGYTTFKYIVQGLKEFCKDTKVQLGTLSTLIAYLFKRFDLVGELLTVFGCDILMAALSLSSFIVLCLFRKHNALIFDALTCTVKIVQAFVYLLDLSSPIAAAVNLALLKIGATETAKTTAKMSTRLVANGVFIGLGMILDAASIIMSLSRSDYDSPLTVELRKTADALEEEQKVIKELYKAVFPREWFHMS